MLSKFGLVLGALLVALILVPSVSTSAGPIVIAPTPTPTPGVPPGSSDRVSSQFGWDLPKGGPDPQEMESFRGELLAVVDDLNAVADVLYPVARAKGLKDMPLAKMDRVQVTRLSHEELYHVREAFARYSSFDTLKRSVAILKAYIVAYGKELASNNQGNSVSPDYFGNVPTPTPYPPPPTGPGIRHDTVEEALPKNDAAGNILTKDGQNKADYALFGVLNERVPPQASLAALVAWEVARAVAIPLYSACKAFVITCPFGAYTNAPFCTAKSIADGINQVLGGIYQVLMGLVDSVDTAELIATFENTQILHSDLIDHDKNLTTRFNTIDENLFNFQNLNLRQRIEANLSSETDDPVVLYSLPSSICVAGYTNPNQTALAPGCGMLEVVSDTVSSAVGGNLAAGEKIYNAVAEYQAAVQHYNAGEWKLAYARFRKAYREATRP